MATKFTPSYAGIGEMLRSDGMEQAMREHAGTIMAAAQAAAPVWEDGPHPGRYKESFRVTTDKESGAKHDRAGAHVVNDAPEAFYVEFGNRNVERYRTLGRAAYGGAR